LLCAFIFAGHIIAIDAFSPKCDGVRMSCIQFFVAFILNSIITLITDSPIDFSAIGDALPSLLYLGICSSGIAYTLQIVGQGMENVNPAVASVILSLESVFGVLGGAIFLEEIMTPREYLGCAIVFVAVVVSQIEFSSIFKKKPN
jgi:drug/metabolite transporter (DMT)-like permease